MKGSKGSTFDVLLIVLVVFVMGVMMMVGNTVLTQVVAATNETGALNHTIVQSGINAVRGYDAMMPFIIVGLVIVSIVLAFQIPTHPVFIVPAMFSMIIIIVIAAQFSNIYDRIADTSALAAEAEQQPITLATMENLPMVALILGIVIMLAMFLATRRGVEVSG